MRVSKNIESPKSIRVHAHVPSHIATRLTSLAKSQGYPTRESYLRDVLEQLANDNFQLDHVKQFDEACGKVNEVLTAFIPEYRKARQLLFAKLDESYQQEYQEWLKSEFGDDTNV